MYQFGQASDSIRSSNTGAQFETRNPADPKTVTGEYVSTPPETLQEIAALAAQAQKGWGALPPVERARIVTRFLDRVEAQAGQITLSVTREQGKPLAEARGELGKSLREARFMVSEGARADGQVVPAQRPGMRNLIITRPRGVIAAITPWNFPVLTPMRKIAPALVHGNAIILKPSEYTPAAACLMAEAARDILPDGLFQIVLGGAETGAALVSLPAVQGVTFTGSVATGRAIYKLAADNLAEISLELGGKNAAIINDTHDMTACLDQVVNAAFQCAGQRCTAISRVIVSSRLADEVTQGLIERAQRVRLGDGMKQDTTMGPLIHADQLRRVERLVQQGLTEGAQALTGAQRASNDGLGDGYFYQPTILSGVDPAATVAREEIFGPVISVLTYSDFDEALQILNTVDYGLTSALFSNNNELVQRFLNASQNGMLHINHGTVPDDHMPFGGIKNSGVGAYSVGSSSARFYTTEHSAYIKFE